jgi:hypothetical protein
MISHEHRCIFVHLHRTGGTSIERALAGDDWWAIDPATKHLAASQARHVYADYWDSYFKFSIVRNPYTRMLSCTKFGGFFSRDVRPGCTFGEFLHGYMARFGFPVTFECDHRFYAGVTSARGLPNAVYLNMLDADLDYVGRFERLDEDFAYICDTLNVPTLELEHLAASDPVRPIRGIDRGSIELLEALFRRDLEHFGYELPDEDSVVTLG